MTNLHYIILSALIISSASISGILLIKSSKRIATYISNNLLTLSSLSAGVFLVTSFLLITETLHLLPLNQALIAYGIGLLAYVLLHQVFRHHRHGDSHEHHEHHKKQSAWKMLIGDTLHNIADGLLLVSSFGFGTSIGITNALSIVLHEIPQEISEFIVLKKSGYTNREAVYRNIATALSIFVGVGIGLALISTESVQAYILGATGTFFLGIVFTDLFPLKTVVKSSKKWDMLAALLIGILLMASISQALGHEHSHEGHDHDHGHEHHEEHEHEHEEEFDLELVEEDHHEDEHSHDEHDHDHGHSH